MKAYAIDTSLGLRIKVGSGLLGVGKDIELSSHSFISLHLHYFWLSVVLETCTVVVHFLYVTDVQGWILVGVKRA